MIITIISFAYQGNHHILRFEVSDDGKSVKNDAHPDVFVVMNPGLSDGFRVDTEGIFSPFSQQKLK
jgi:sugar lactone lactonase YvrE